MPPPKLAVIPGVPGASSAGLTDTIPVGGKISANVNISKRRRTFNKNFTAYRRESLDQIIRELQKSCQEMQEAIIELQELQLPSRVISEDGAPAHGTACELFNGQFLRLTQLGIGPTVVTVEHGLRRRPQGAIFIQATAHNIVYIGGSIAANIPPANERAVSFQLNGAANDEHICILF